MVNLIIIYSSIRVRFRRVEWLNDPLSSKGRSWLPVLCTTGQVERRCPNRADGNASFGLTEPTLRPVAVARSTDIFYGEGLSVAQPRKRNKWSFESSDGFGSGLAPTRTQLLDGFGSGLVPDSCQRKGINGKSAGVSLPSGNVALVRAFSEKWQCAIASGEWGRASGCAADGGGEASPIPSPSLTQAA